MATQLLFYEAAVPVSAARHGNWSIEPRDYSFSKSINSVPLTTVEFASAASEYSIVFAGQPGSLVPAAILGMRASENLYLNDKGDWDAKYVPAFVRRYPFVFSSPDEGKNFMLCIDEPFTGFNQEGRGQRLFNEENKASAYTESVLKFLQGYELEFRRTRDFCRMLEELELLESMQAQVSVNADERISLTGFMAVSRDKLKALPAAKLAELTKSDELEFIYLHLQSMRNFALMRGRLGSTSVARPQPEAMAASPEPEPEPKAPEAKPRKRAERKLPS
ncbi:MAG: multidrug transporter [Ramlibacter sp.]|nr:multidrug transporter [Ramlibacter sp.]